MNKKTIIISSIIILSISSISFFITKKYVDVIGEKVAESFAKAIVDSVFIGKKNE